MKTDVSSNDCAVVIIGAGPCGLMLAVELGRRGVSTIVLEEKSALSRFPSANATQARTMEHYRRLGFAEKVRSRGLPPDYPTDIAYFSRYTKYELARISLPSARQAREIVKTLTGSWSAAELPHRISQIFVEDVLRAEIAALPSVSLRPGWRMIALRDTGIAVEVDTERSDSRERVRLRAAYVLSADGGGSPTRKALGYSYVGESGVVRDFVGGRMFAIHIRSSRLYDVIPHPRAWMYWAVNAERRGLMPSVNGRDEFTFHTQLRSDEKPEQITDGQAKLMFQTALGTNLDVEILARSTWNAGYTLVAEKFQRGRIFLGGDAAHLFTPTGGLGYNTAVEDAVNLGWKLAALIKGWGGPGLLASYETERQVIARRNTAYARRFADSVGLFVPPPELEEDSPAGEAARKRTADYFNYHARFEFNIPGVTFGGRYDGSPIIVTDNTSPPPDRPNDYVPTACPGGRAPHLWLADGRSLYDTFGFEFTLLQLGTQSPDATPFETAAEALEIPLSVVSVVAMRPAISIKPIWH
jgi:2-polyprenyl-6-methoxyphenol hydroxylase-like FAD-dependent oxidoreductase